MAFYSDLHGAKVIDETNAHQYAQDPSTAQMRGYVARDYSRAAQGTYAPIYSRSLIPRSEWDARIEELEKKKATLKDLHRAKNVPILNQKTLGYCWIYGIVGAMMTVRAKQGLKTLTLSATSAGAKIKNYRNVGGWGGEALNGIAKFGVSTVEYWPEAVLDRRYDTQEQRANAALHKHSEFEELPRNNFDALATALLRLEPTSMALNWWGHLVYGVRLLKIGNNAYGVEIPNSWGPTWENGGYGVLAESKAVAHEAISVISTTPSVL